MNKKVKIYVFLDNIPFATVGILYGLEENPYCDVKSFYPSKYKSRRNNVDVNFSLTSCFSLDYSKDLVDFEKNENSNLNGATFISFGYVHDSFRWASYLSKKYDGNNLEFQICMKLKSKGFTNEEIEQIKTGC